MGEGRERGEGRREEMRKGREGVGSEQRGKREGVLSAARLTICSDFYAVTVFTRGPVELASQCLLY